MECLRNPGKNKRILFVGEGNFSFSCNLTENWDMGTLSVLATCYESELRLLVIDILTGAAEAVKHWVCIAIMESLNKFCPIIKIIFPLKLVKIYWVGNCTPKSTTLDMQIPYNFITKLIYK